VIEAVLEDGHGFRMVVWKMRKKIIFNRKKIK
jgi:hypothetical protein